MAHMIDVHAELARRHRVHILAASGPCRTAAGTYVNRARLFAPSGQHGAQDKQIMTPFEQDWGITAGTGLQVFQTALGVIGIAICYDSEFPLLVHSLCAAGAEIVLVPSCTEFVSGWARVRTAAMARALENTCIIVQSPTIGQAPWSPAVDANAGAAGIFAPAERGLSDTGVLACGELNASGWVYATADLAHLRRVQDSGEMRNARDWRLQPGAQSLAHHVTRVSLFT
jgi:predicted amidohydrolase